jgi:hypothetical protein
LANHPTTFTTSLYVVGRPFAVPLGTIGIIMLSIPPMFMIIVLMLLASYTTLIFCLTANVFAFFLLNFAGRIEYSAIGRTATSATGDTSIYPAEENLQAVKQID